MHSDANSSCEPRGFSVCHTPKPLYSSHCPSISESGCSGKSTCHVERSEAKSKHLQLSFASFRVGDSRRVAPADENYRPGQMNISGKIWRYTRSRSHPPTMAKPLVMLSEAQRSRNICSCPSRVFPPQKCTFPSYPPHLRTTGKATCHVERSEAKSKHLQLSSASFPPQQCAFPSSPSASLEDPLAKHHCWNRDGKSTCHVERREAKSKHLQLSFASFPVADSRSSLQIHSVHSCTD